MLSLTPCYAYNTYQPIKGFISHRTLNYLRKNSARCNWLFHWHG